MLPDAAVSHITAGRMRIKIASKKGDAAYFSCLHERFSSCEGIERLEVNALTGSVLFINPADIKVIAAYAEANKLFKLGRSQPDTTPFSNTIAKTFKAFDKKTKSFTGNDMDIPGAAFLVLLGVGIYQISRGNFTAPAWYTAFWYALNIFLKSQQAAGSE